MSTAVRLANRRLMPRTGAIETTIGGQRRYCISGAQRTIHVASESIAVFLVTPFMFWLATRKELPSWARTSSAVIGAGTLLVDGGLLVSYLKKEKT